MGLASHSLTMANACSWPAVPVTRGKCWFHWWMGKLVGHRSNPHSPTNVISNQGSLISHSPAPIHLSHIWNEKKEVLIISLLSILTWPITVCLEWTLLKARVMSQIPIFVSIALTVDICTHRGAVYGRLGVWRRRRAGQRKRYRMESLYLLPLTFISYWIQWEWDPSLRQILAHYPHSWFNGWHSICGLNNL